MSEPSVRVAVEPWRIDALVDAVRSAGGLLTPPAQADALVWTDASDPHGLAAALETSPARWVQLPFAGIESFFDAGVVDPARTWTCAKGIYGPATAEQALALLLAAARRLHEHIRSSGWLTEDDPPRRRLAGSTAAIVGTGGIGSALAGFLAPLGVRIVGVNRDGRPVAWAERTVGVADVVTVAAEADWLVIAAPLTEHTRGLIGADVLTAMKPDGWLVNVARGGLVDTDALVEALEGDRIGGAALDVTDPEPLPGDHPLWRLPNVIITSHTGNTFRMAIPDLAAAVERNVRAFAEGRALEGLVDPALGY